MKQSFRQQLWTILILLFSTLSSFSNARYGYHGGGGWTGAGGVGGDEGMGMGSSGSSGRREMMQLIHQLVDSHEDVTRYYNETDVGIESYTFSDDPDVASWIQNHVSQMVELMTTYPEYGGFRLRDPLFRSAFDFSSFHEMIVTNTDEGVHVVQKVVVDVDDAMTKACTISIIQDHAAVVSKFVTHGSQEMRKYHEAPIICNDVPRKIPEDTHLAELTAQDTTVRASGALTTNASNAATDIGSKLQIAPILTCILCSLLF
jgi:hypothetical protein